jgi:hypothetical protein
MYIRESLSIKNKYNKYNPRKNIPDNDKKSKNNIKSFNLL